MNIIVVEPNKPAYPKEISGSLKSMQEIVGGLIEPIYYLDDPRAVIIGNEEARLMGLESNWRFKQGTIVGTFFICGDDGDDFCSLPLDLREKYLKDFSQPQETPNYKWIYIGR